MNPKLSVEIGADVKGMEAALKKADALLKQHERNYKGVQNAISQNTQKSQQLEKSISRLSTEYQRGNISQAKFSKETDRLTNELSQVNNSTADYQKELRRLDREMDRVAQSTANYSQSTARVNTASNQAATGMGRMGKTARVNATPAMMSFGQVIQDAPYGIRGVANNITMLVEQLGYMSKSAGGAKGAVKAMGASLLGPTGLIVGVSLLTSAMVAFSNSGMRLSDVLSFVTGNSNKAAQAQRKLAESYREAQGDVMAEMAVLKSLIDVARDETRSRKDRQRAIDAVNDKFPELHENLRLETVNSEKAKIAIDKLTESLLRQAKIEGVKGLIADTYAEIAEIAQKSAVDSASWWDIVEAAMLPVIDKGASVVAQGFSAQGEAIDKAREKVESYKETLKKLIGEDIATQGVYTDVDAGGGKTDPVEVPFVFPEPSMTAEEAKEAIAFVESEMEKNGLKVPILMDALDEANFYSDLNQKREDFFAASEEGWAEHNEKVKELTAEQMLQAQLLGNAFSSLASNLTNSLIEGSFSVEEFGKTIMKTFSQIVIKLAQQALMEKLISKGQLATDFTLAQGNAAVAATSAAAAMGPAGVIALPGLLASMSSIVGGFFGGLMAFADGGIVGGTSTYGDKILARVNSGELILNNDQQKSLYKQLQAPNMIMSTANEPVELYGKSSISGDQIDTVWRRANNRRGRVS